MRFVPDYCVSYRGAFHYAGCAFEIDPKDAEEMSRHGTVMQEVRPVEPEEPEPRRGRPKKTEE